MGSCSGMHRVRSSSAPSWGAAPRLSAARPASVSAISFPVAPGRPSVGPPRGQPASARGRPARFPVGVQPIGQLAEVDLVAVELGAVAAGVLALASIETPAATAHPRPVDHDRFSETVVLTPYGRVARSRPASSAPGRWRRPRRCHRPRTVPECLRHESPGGRNLPSSVQTITSPVARSSSS